MGPIIPGESWDIVGEAQPGKDLPGQPQQTHGISGTGMSVI